MAVRSFWWDANIIGRPRYALARSRRGNLDSVFRRGNAGDIFNVDVIERTYREPAVNVKDDGRRLLLIGSVAHTVRHGDVVCGVGTKGTPIPSARDAHCIIRAVRGPLTLEAFTAAGHDVSDVRSQLDPGLLIRFHEPDRAAVRGRTGFLPHYRERASFRSKVPEGLRLLNIDDSPHGVARQIQRVELLYTSSLHGLIFAHALGRPCVLVQPLTEEPEIKYRDYLASVGVPWTGWRPLEEALRAASPNSPVDLSYTAEQFALPDRVELGSLGVATS